MSDYDDEDVVAGDFYSLVGSAQLAELIEVERKREHEREAMKALEIKRNSTSMTLMQIAGMKTQKELAALQHEKNAVEEAKSNTEESERKKAENAKLTNAFPPPDLKHQ